MSTEDFFEQSTEQSRIKASIVREYFWAWAKVILPFAKQRGERIAYVDLFSGPGKYGDGTKSTPLLVLETAIADVEIRGHLVTLFNDADKENATRLQMEIDNLPRIENLKYRPQVSSEEVGDNVPLLKQTAGLSTLYFIDPWGYKELSLKLIAAVLENWGSDCIFFFNYNRVNPALDNPIVERRMNLLFGEERANELRLQLAGLSSQKREAGILEALYQSLRGRGARYLRRFTFKDEHGTRTSHHLILATKHSRGYGIMKDIMAKYSSEEHQGVASFGYTPMTSHPTLFELNRPLDDLEGMLLKEFAGSTLTMLEIYDRHNDGRDYTMKNYKAVLLSMEERGLINANPPSAQRPKGTFADHVKVTFPN